MGTVNAHYREDHGTGPARKSYWGAVTWSCPDGCGGELSEQGAGGMVCDGCKEAFSYARLAAECDG